MVDPRIPADIPGKDRYRQLYRNGLESEAEWLRRCAVEKVNSIETLLKRNGIVPRTILELGCGTGAVMQECRRRNLGTEYLAVDAAPEAVGYVRRNCVGVEAMLGDISEPNFRIDRPIDLLVLSHVLEHLEDPKGFLCAIRKSVTFKYAVIEVPLENLMYGRIKNIFIDRNANKAGHVNFFSIRAVRELLMYNRMRIIDCRTYVPVLDMSTVRFVSDKAGLSRSRYLLKAFINRYALKWCSPVWKRLFYAHYAALCGVE